MGMGRFVCDRLPEYLITDSMIDKRETKFTGTSRIGQAALLAGAIDERIALTAPVAGKMALRFSGKEWVADLDRELPKLSTRIPSGSDRSSENS